MGAVVGPENTVSYAEVHASVVGLVVGLFAAYVLSIGYPTVGVGLGVTFVTLSLGVGACGRVPAAQRVVRHEPWYALAAFALGAGGALLVA